MVAGLVGGDRSAGTERIIMSQSELSDKSVNFSALRTVSLTLIFSTLLQQYVRFIVLCNC